MKKPAPVKNLPLGLYIHVPFCRSKCAYCDFYSLSGSENFMDDYCRALERHLIEVAPQAACHLVDTIYFGGGTPSFYGDKRLRELLKATGQDDTLARQVEETYREEKSLKKAYYLNAFRNG